MSAKVHWGVSIPMACQVCHRPVANWYSVVNDGAGDKLLSIMVSCHGASENQVYIFSPDCYLPLIHPATAFPLPKPWPAFLVHQEIIGAMDEAWHCFRAFGMSAREAHERIAELFYDKERRILGASFRRPDPPVRRA